MVHCFKTHISPFVLPLPITQGDVRLIIYTISERTNANTVGLETFSAVCLILMAVRKIFLFEPMNQIISEIETPASINHIKNVTQG